MKNFKKIETIFLLLFIIYIQGNRVRGAPKRRICLSYIAPDLNAPVSSYDDDDDVDEENSSQTSMEAEDYEEANDFASLPSPTTLTQLQPFGESQHVECPNVEDFCYSLWQIGINGTITIVRQGCWEISDKQRSCRRPEECISDGPTPSASKSHRFCCCSSDLCNVNVSSIEPIETAESVIASQTEGPELAPLQSMWISPIFWICVTTSILTLLALAMFLGCRQVPKPGPEVAPLAPSGPGYSSNLQNVDNLKVCSLLGQGKYGTVWKGLINEQPVAVKIFPQSHRQYFLNEKNIYSLPLMDSSSLLTYFGCDERRTLDDHIEYFLVLSLAPYGCLQDWLKENTTSYSTFCKMSKSIARGLSHLHTELHRGGQVKPCVCHRDFNSRNILVKSDLSCCVADFGFALKAFGARYEYKGEISVAEIKSINEVGTLRYMAPEVLEGAVNLRDCETALKQIDVYSLGLVLWELCTRCQDLYPQGQAVPEYRLPYEAEIGKHPTFEQIQVLVSRHKARPLFPPGWGGGPAGRIARETCEDCWDHDAEARLTSLCAEERIQELTNLKLKSHISRGPSPPLSANNLAGNSSNSNLVQNLSGSSYSGGNSSQIFNAIETGVITPPNQIIPIVNNFSISNNNIAGSSNSRLKGNNLLPIAEKNHVIYSKQIQPFQGRNPCQERNLAPISTHNQILVEKSRKHSFLDRSVENSFSCMEDDVSVEDLMSTHQQSRVTSQSDESMGQGFPKQNNTDSKLGGWHGVRALIQKKLFRRSTPATISDEKSNLVDTQLIGRIQVTTRSPTQDIRVNLIDTSKKFQNGVQTQLEFTANTSRPSNLDLIPITVRVNEFSIENSPGKSDISESITDDGSCSVNYIYKTPPGDESGQQFAVVQQSAPRIVISKSANAMKALSHSAEEKLIKRQRSLEVFREVKGVAHQDNWDI